MSDASDHLVVTIGVFGTVGLALGVIGFLAAGVAQARFVDAAGGSAEQFGPVFLNVVHFGVLVTAMFVAPVLAGALSTFSGANIHDRGRSVGVGAAGSLVGYLLLVPLAVTLTNFGAPDAAAPLVGNWSLLGGGAVATAFVGAVGGLLGSLLY